MRQPIAILGAWGGLLTAALVVGCEPTSSAPPPTGDSSSSAPATGPAPAPACCELLAEGCPECGLGPGSDASDPAGYRRSTWLAPDERGHGGVLGLRVTDQDTKAHNLAELC